MSDQFLYDVFLSHSSADKPAVEELAHRLRESGLEPWLDKWNLVPGEAWQPALEEALRDSATCVVFVGPSGFGDWQHEEMRAAIARRVSSQQGPEKFRVIPVLLPGAVRGDGSKLPGFLTATTWVEFSKTLDDDDAFRRLERAIRGLPPGPDLLSRAHAQPAARVPFQRPPAAERFFGRPTQLDELTTRLKDARNTVVVGPAGNGKTALAAEALTRAIGSTPESLANSPFPDGVVFLDLYAFQGQADPVWNALADAVAGREFQKSESGEGRARQACQQRQLLVIFEGAEEADGHDGHTTRPELLSVLSAENRWLLLTRDKSQALAKEMLPLEETLSEENAAALFDSLCGGHVTEPVRTRILNLLDGHPLALTWAGHLLARDAEHPATLADDWEAQPALRLSDPLHAEHTLNWLFDRSVRGLDETARQALSAAGLVARAPFPDTAIQAALSEEEEAGRERSVTPEVRAVLRRLTERGLLRLSAMEGSREFTHVLGYRFARNETSSDPGLRQRLAAWVHQRLTNALKIGSDTGDVSDLLQHASALLRTDHDQRLWRPLAIYLLYGACDRFVSLGRSDWAHAALNAVSAWFDGFPMERIDEPGWQREQAVCFNRLGDLATAQGNLPEAQRLFGKSLRIAQRLADSDPGNAAWQSDLAVSLNKLGDLAKSQGNLPEAQRLFGESLRIAQRLADSDPANAEWQRDLAVSLNKLGDLAKSQGNLPEAQRLFGESLRIAQRLADSDPGNAGWQRDLSVSFERLGGLATAQGNLPEAQRLFGEFLRIAQRLADSDPGNAEWQRDLSVSFERLGGLATAQGNLPEAQRLFGEALRIRQRLADSDLGNAEWQRDLSVSLNKLGEVATAQGNLPEAQRLCGEALRIAQRLADSDPANAEWQRDLSVSLNKLGDVATAQGNLPEAQRLFGEALCIAQRLADSDPGNAAWQRDLLLSLRKLGDLATVQGNLPEAQRLFGEDLHIAQRLADSDPGNAEWQRDLWVSHWRVANVLDKLQSPKAMTHWRQAHETLQRMVSENLFVSAADLPFLERLRDKLNST